MFSGSCAPPALGGPDDHMLDVLPWGGGGEEEEDHKRGARRRGVMGEGGEEVRSVEDEDADDGDGDAEGKENQEDEEENVRWDEDV